VSIQVAKATYFWGSIDRDTIWTLVDSPFVISGDVIIYPGVTLTIEPAVQVMFGGNFSLIVQGNLIADGTQTKEINFTSNNLNPNPEYWGTIQLNDTNSYASLINCIVEYATDGITLEAGKLAVQNSQVCNNGNGIVATGGTLETNGTTFENNVESGVLVENDGQVLFYNNNLTLNSDGITLATNQGSQVDIEQNIFLNNTHSGISLTANDTDAYQDTQITNNTLYANDYGFYVSTDANTSITGNDVLNNTVGIYYEAGQANEAHFNDIYDNGMGMDVADNATVDATYNYWGDKTGPEHDFLNPHGKGNPVGGDATTLKFIFFLTRPFEDGNQPPTATLQTDKTLVTVGQSITFIGANSVDDGQVDQYLYSFGDGNDTGWTTLSMFNYSYSSPGTYMASLGVTDDFNASSQNAATANITVAENLTPLNVAITLDSDTADFNESVPVTVYVSTDTGPANNTLVSLLSVTGGTFTPTSGSTNSSGYFTTIFTAPNVTQVSNVRIVATAASPDDSEYSDGSDYAYLEVLPPLYLQISPNATTINSEDNTPIAVSVTDAFEKPVSNVNLTLLADNGTLSTPFVTTDSQGTATFSFEAPLTLSQTTVTITITASKPEYAVTQGQQVITVNPKPLTLEITVANTTIVSEATTAITAHVAFNSTPIPGATITASSDIGGNFTGTENLTDSNGDTDLVFNAPQITVNQTEVATITVTAHEQGYVDAEDNTTVAVQPKILIVQVTSQLGTLNSTDTTGLTVHVTCPNDTEPVSQANVTITSENGGNFSTTTGMTDQNGDWATEFTAPLVDTSINATILASASKTGYVLGQNSLPITVNPGTLEIQIIGPETIMSGNTSIVTIQVTSNSTPIANASVTILTDYGRFSTNTLQTDSSGQCTFVFFAPNVTIQSSATIKVNVTRNGYFNATSQSLITVLAQPVTSKAGGWPSTTILLIIMPVIILVVIVALIKLKVIVISVEE
jgi:parallel beta-helix repeat protein